MGATAQARVYTTTVIRSRLSLSACLLFVPACVLKKQIGATAQSTSPLTLHTLFMQLPISTIFCWFVVFLAYALFMGAIVLYRHLCLYTTADTDTTHTVHAAAYQYHSLLVSCLSYALFMGSTLLYRLLCQHHHRHYAHSSCSCLLVSTIIFCLFVVFTYAIFMDATVLYRH